ncbi:DegT/DnrJ/EryC1/StrS family aminotransferase [Hydrogenophaga crassostreae]|uniref:DegT/DnrJ/EryC1/StrS family aminotransferase n=1 Tax=Hydrogenophaga crassostreae TaxID=1763535 RepID=UPI0018D409C9|nr:DegT/DnrJ/EryC1/StrS family aminotransferase [Hydrogenophaga crassostreae]
MNKIPVFDFLAQYKGLQTEIQAAMEGVLESGQLILGPQGKRFETAFSEYLGAIWARLVSTAVPMPWR